MQKHGLLTVLGIFLALGALYWIAPLTTAGRTVLVATVILFVNAVGALLWRR